ARIGKTEAFIVGAQSLRSVAGVLALRRGERGRGVVRSRFAHQHAAAGAETRDAKGREEEVQQARVVSVADVLEIKLPVVRQRLGEAADDLELAIAEHAANAVGDALPEPGFDVGRLR